MEVNEISTNYKFDKREIYLSFKWKTAHSILYLICSLIGFVGCALVRFLEYSSNNVCPLYSNISAIEEEGKWFVIHDLSVWSKQHCYALNFIFIISFAYGLIWTVYFFTCSISQYKDKMNHIEGFHGYGPPQRLVLPALVVNVLMTLASVPLAIDGLSGVAAFCSNMMELTNSYTCMEAAKLIYFKESNNLERAKIIADNVRIFCVALFISWLFNTLFMIARIFFFADYNLMKEINIEFVLHNKPGKNMQEVYGQRLRVWGQFLREKGLTSSVISSIREIEFTCPSSVEEHEYGDVYFHDRSYNIALTESTSTYAGGTDSDDDIHSKHHSESINAEELQLLKPNELDIVERGEISDWVDQELDQLVIRVTHNSSTNDDIKVEMQDNNQNADVSETNDDRS